MQQAEMLDNEKISVGDLNELKHCKERLVLSNLINGFRPPVHHKLQW